MTSRMKALMRLCHLLMLLTVSCSFLVQACGGSDSGKDAEASDSGFSDVSPDLDAGGTGGSRSENDSGSYQSQSGSGGEQRESGTDGADCTDSDGDGFCEEDDCDDESNSVYPNALESCNDRDDDCDGETDEDFESLGDDCDGDDSDQCANGSFVCNGSGDGVECGEETPRDIEEQCNDEDDDCDGETDEDFESLGDDCDGDDSDQCANGTYACNREGDAVECVDESPEGIEEICNDEDDDCDGETDEDPIDGTAFYPDRDGDGYGDQEGRIRFCLEPAAPYIETGGDCDDTLAYVHPGVPELPDDGVDQNCDDAELSIDDDTAVFVDPEGDNSDPGTRALPKETINAAITSAETEGKVVVVAEGTYVETILSPDVSIFGGYESDNWTRDIEANPTVIALQAQPGIQLNHTAFQGFTIQGWDAVGTYFVYSLDVQTYASDEDAIVLVADNVFQGGSASPPNGPTQSDFSAIMASGGNLYLLRNDVDGGTASYSSSGIRTLGGRVWAFDNQINGGAFSTANNSRAVYVLLPASWIRVAGGHLYGGTGNASYGAMNYSGNLLLDGVQINGEGGASTQWSYGVSCNYHDFAEVCLIINSTIEGGNGTTTSTGAVLRATEDDTIAVVNSIVRGGNGGDTRGIVLDLSNPSSTPIRAINNLIDGGAGIATSIGVQMVNDDSSLVLLNNIIDGGNGATAYGVSLRNIAVLNSNLIYGPDTDCLLYAIDDADCINDIDAVNTCTWTGCDQASENISVDPQFDSDGLHLSSDSDCIGAGVDPSTYYSEPIVDIDGENRPLDEWDIGVDEI